MIDYDEITVNVSNLTHEEKKRVQDAFFKLGFTWWGSTDYACLNKKCYTNTLKEGKVTQDLMWADESAKPTHTVDELLELAGMKTDTKPFDLEKALKGEPVVLRNGIKAYIRHYETQVKTKFPLIGYVADGKTEGKVVSWMEDGRYYWDVEVSEYNIASMWVEPIVFDHWHILIEDINYLAKDRDGDWIGYGEKPSKVEGFWAAQSLDGYYSVESLNPTLFPECDWENSLIERPEND